MKVVGRLTNVDVHRQITQSAVSVIGKVLGPPPAQDGVMLIKMYQDKNSSVLMTLYSEKKKEKTLLLLHG